MIRSFIFFLLSLLFSQITTAMSASCFNYEILDHSNLAYAALLAVPPPPHPVNQAMTNYGYGLILAQNIAIPPLRAGVPHQIGVSLRRQAAPALPWAHVLIPAGGALTLQQACMMAINRQDIGITIKFANLPLITLLAQNTPLHAIAALLAMPVGNIVPESTNALRAGGYLTPLAAALFNLRHAIGVPNFSIIAAPAGLNPFAQNVILHFHGSRRVSKNVKELSVNSVLNPAQPGLGPYVSLKDMINAQFVGPTNPPPPHSGTVITSDFLQKD
ncbi:MAG: hypothetical protein FJX71_06585 [Alphaproteobacteria bacterium]|nr:hypothetical protein [Alphaproteobacteria bacterium]